MRWYHPLYLSKNTAGQIDKIREKAAAGAWVPGIYFVTLSSEPGHLLDLFHNTMLKESIFRDVQRLDIVGVAQDVLMKNIQWSHQKRISVENI